ncbi:MAG: hypothetical protein QXI59_02865 [Candidatus Bathyarchaeia archaeon]
MKLQDTKTSPSLKSDKHLLDPMHNLTRINPILPILLLSIILVGSVRGQEYTKIDGRKGNVADPNADILEVNFQLLKDGTLTIKYVIAGSFDLKKYIYGINLYDYGSDQALHPIANIILGTFEQKQGVWFVNSSTLKVDPLQYSIEGSTLTISGLTIELLGYRYAFYASAETAQPTTEQTRTVIWVDHEPHQGAVKIMFPTPSTTPTQTPQTSPQQTAQPQPTTPKQSPATYTPQETTPTKQNYATQIIIIAIFAFICVSGLVVWRSRSKKIQGKRQMQK